MDLYHATRMVFTHAKILILYLEEISARVNLITIDEKEEKIKYNLPQICADRIPQIQFKSRTSDLD